RRSVTETAGFYNTSGFNDDTRAFFSIPARHDMARRMDCRFLAEWVMEGRIDEDDAMNLISVLTLDLVLEAYRLDPNILGIASHQRTSRSETDPNHDEVHHA
ncbi:MAG: glucuronate isomerase, partial [Pseudomonadales bacterium]